MRVAIMQPAFIPPASYFRLFAATRVFVILDTVQFNRRWYTHRQQLTNRRGEKEWLTLPIAHGPRDTTMIKDLQWEDVFYRDRLLMLKRFSVFDVKNAFTDYVSSFGGHRSFGSFLNDLLLNFAATLGLAEPVLSTGARILCASEIEVDPALTGQERIIALCKALGATHYINSPGGKGLYDPEAFERAGIELSFLNPYRGSNDSILERLTYEDAQDVKEEIYANL